MNQKMMLASILAITIIVSFAVMIDDGAEASDTAKYSVDGVEYDTWANAQGHVKDGSYIQLLSNGVIDAGSMTLNGTGIVFDLNDCTLTVTTSSTDTDSVDGITVSAGAEVTITDSGNGNGCITSTQNINNIVVKGELTIDGGMIKRDMNSGGKGSVIENEGVLVVNGGKIAGSTVYQTSTDGLIRTITTSNGGSIVVNDGEITNNNGQAINLNTHATGKINGGIITGGFWGVGVLGPGQTDGVVDNSKVTLTINGGMITASKAGGQGIGTNASSGTYAGHTITINGGTVSVPNGGVGIYGPSYGVYNILGGEVSGGSQGIRIAAGILNISGDAIVSANSPTSISDGLVSGGSGGASGAIVAGKAGTGYWGDLQINITGGNITNQNSEGDAIVFSDAYMGTETFKGNSIELNLDGGSVNGDIQNITSTTYNLEGDKISDISDVKPSDNNARMNLNGGLVAGDVIQSSLGCSPSIDGAIITGGITKNDDAQPVVIESGIIGGDVPDGTSKTGIVTLVYPDGSFSFPYYGSSFVLMYETETPGYIVGWSSTSGSDTIEYQMGEKVENLSGDVTFYLIILPEDYQPEPSPGYDDDEDLPPFIPTQPAEDDDTVTIVACAAAAAVAAIMAVFLIIDRKG